MSPGLSLDPHGWRDRRDVGRHRRRQEPPPRTLLEAHVRAQRDLLAAFLDPPALPAPGPRRRPLRALVTWLGTPFVAWCFCAGWWLGTVQDAVHGVPPESLVFDVLGMVAAFVALVPPAYRRQRTGGAV